MHMGTIHLARIQDYLKMNRLINISSFRDSVSRPRPAAYTMSTFCKNSEVGDPKPENSLFEITLFINYFNNKMAQIYYPLFIH